MEDQDYVDEAEKWVIHTLEFYQDGMYLHDFVKLAVPNTSGFNVFSQAVTNLGIQVEMNVLKRQVYFIDRQEGIGHSVNVSDLM